MLGWEDPIIFLQVRVDSRGVGGVKFLVNASYIWYIMEKLKLYNTCISLPILDVHIVGIAESNYFLSRYGGSKWGGRCKISCESPPTQCIKDKVCRIFRTGGSNSLP
jgi:hypothetical protein